MSTSILIQDVFGSQVKLGQLVLLSKGNRGARDFEQGIVIEILTTGKQLKIKTLDSFIAYGSKQLITSEHYHYVNKGINNNLLIVDNPEQKSALPKNILDCIPILISKYQFPDNYQLGQEVPETSLSVEQESSAQPDLAITGIELSDDLEPKLFSILGTPKSLIKEC